MLAGRGTTGIGTTTTGDTLTDTEGLSALRGTGRSHPIRFDIGPRASQAQASADCQETRGFESSERWQFPPTRESTFAKGLTVAARVSAV